MNQVYMVVGPIKYTKALYGSFSLGESQRSLYRLQQLTIVHTVRQCTYISEADPDISIQTKNRISKPFYFNRNIKRYRDVIQSENYKTW